MNANARPSGSTSIVMPSPQYLDTRRALETMAMSSGRRLLNSSVGPVTVIGIYAGALIAAGALFSVLPSAEAAAQGPRRLLEGLGFYSGFFLWLVLGSKDSAMINAPTPARIHEHALVTLTPCKGWSTDEIDLAGV